MREEIEEYINNNYDILEEHPWKEYPNFTTFKHQNNKKWFALIMDVPYEKLNIDKEGKVEVINLKNIPELIGGLRKVEGILPAYHMNKEHWISVLLDGTVPKEKVCELIDISYDLTK
ncbi:MAG: MmcQ/YjbR family DNA-binding protein [Clostridia bacterium]|nr:MmcQ/YjbR family DNA-binding protein [Clostridia bacterium]